MLFRLRNRANPVQPTAQQSDSGTTVAVGDESRHWLIWRQSAQRVTRAWNEWLAADSGRRPGAYRRYLDALVAEQQAAAEMERVLNIGARQARGNRSPPA